MGEQREAILANGSGPKAGGEGVVEDVKGRAKEAAGAVSGNESLKQEGEAQQEKAAAQRYVAAKEAEAGEGPSGSERGRSRAALAPVEAERSEKLPVPGGILEASRYSPHNLNHAVAADVNTPRRVRGRITPHFHLRD